MRWTQISHCVRCFDKVHMIVDYPEAFPERHIMMSYYIPQLCDKCLADGWRFDIGGGIINEYDEPKVSLLDLLEETTTK